MLIMRLARFRILDVMEFWVPALCALLLAAVSLPAMAQTACPGGATAGSRLCGPDGAPQNFQVVRYDAHGAVAYSTSSGLFYYTTGANSGGMPSVRADAMTQCAQDGNQDCNLLGTWTNSCATFATVLVDGLKQPLFTTGSNSRKSRRAARAECERLAPGGKCDVRKTECIFFRTDLVPY